MEIAVLAPADLDRFAGLFPDELRAELPTDALLLGCMQAEPPTAAGILMAHVAESEVLIDWLYVDEPFRRQGGGRAMLEALISASDESDSVDGVNIAYTEAHEHMSDFLRACEFMVELREGAKGFTTQLGLFPKLPVVGESRGTIAPLSVVPEKEVARFNKMLILSNHPDIVLPGALVPADYRPESSVCLENGIIRAFCLVKGDRDGLSIESVFNGTTLPATFLNVVNRSVDALKAAFPKETPLSFASVNPSLELFIENSVPVKQRRECLWGTYRLDI